MLTKTSVYSLAALGIISSVASAAIVTVVDLNYEGTAPGLLLRNQLGVALSNGVLTTDGDGFALQLGYYDQATVSNNFSGNFVVLAGFESVNSQYTSLSVGDGEGGAGEFYGSFRFEPSVAGRGTGLPSAVTVPLSIRFYNAASVASATFYNTVSSDAWLWKTPLAENPLPQSTINISSGSPLEFQASGPTSDFRTVIPVPEPTSAFLIAVGAAGLMVRRRRQS